MMTMPRISVSLLRMARISSMLVLGLLCGLPAAVKAESGLERMVRLFSSDFRAAEERMAEIENELAGLPAVREAAWGSRHGHRSGKLEAENTQDWVQLDFGRNCSIDTIALVPANLSILGPSGAGHGFPKRFWVELADNPRMDGAIILMDHSQSDHPHPGRNPVVIKRGPAEGRYLRFTALKHHREDDHYFWAMEELIALEGNHNVADSARLTTSTEMDLYPLWAPFRLIDGQHGLGMPVDLTQASPNLGYLSAASPYDGELDGRLPEGEEGWCMVDLGVEQVIDQLRLLPIESDAYEVYGGRGFPRDFEVQLANDPEFESVLWSGGHPSYPLGYPSGCAITFQVPGIEARYARMVAKQLWSRDNRQVFGLAEFQVYGGGRNLALNRPVTVSDQTELSSDTTWAPAHLVDGYTSRFKLTEWPQHLQQFDLRGQLEQELAALAYARASRLANGRRLMVALGITFGVAVVIAWIWVLTWQRRSRSQAMTQLRMQISRDLHDDIGSNLGGIVLLSDIGSKHSDDEGSRQDFATIREAAEQASHSMRDIVWLVQRDEVGLRDMVVRMREASEMILSDHEVEFEVDPVQFRDRKLSLLFRRHLFFAFKEVLNNVRKHAAAKRVEITIHPGSTGMKFRIRDHGAGFEPGSENGEGHGLGNLQRRASSLEGSVHIISKPGSGCEVCFEANYET